MPIQNSPKHTFTTIIPLDRGRQGMEGERKGKRKWHTCTTNT